MESEEKPFTFDLLSQVHSAIQDLSLYLQFSSEVEALLEKKDIDLQDYIESQLKQIPEVNHGDFVENYGWDLHQYQMLFPSMHRQSMFITLYNFLEHQLNETCRGIGDELESRLRLRDLRGSGIERAFLFLKLVPEFQFEKINEALSFIKNANRLRNIVVHNGGILPSEEDEEVNRFVIAQASLYGGPGREIVFRKEFVPLFTENVRTLFREIESEMQRWMDEHWRKDDSAQPNK